MTDAEKYLARVGLSHAARPDFDFLSDLLRHHVASIPFENVTSCLYGPSPAGAVALDDESIVAKLLGAVDGGPRRGGYCFEHAALLRIVLPQLGFRIRPVLGRVYVDPASAPSAKTHNVSVVQLDGREWLVDPGFGGLTPTAPLDLSALHRVQSTPHGEYRIVPADDAGVDRTLAPDVDVMLQTHIPGRPSGEWTDLYALDLRTAAPADFVALNWYVSTAPGATFTGRLALARASEGERINVNNEVLKRHGADESVTKVFAGVDDLSTALDLVGVDLSAADLEMLWERLQVIGRA